MRKIILMPLFLIFFGCNYVNISLNSGSGDNTDGKPPKSDCPYGETRVFGVCEPSSCETGEVLENGVCVPLSCENGEVLENGECR